MPAYQTAVFDLDGTLLDSLCDLHLSINAVLAAHDMPTHSLDDVRRFVGNGIRKLVERAVPAGTNDAQRDAVYEDFCTYYAAHCEDHTGPYAGIPDLLAHLRAAGVRLAVVSNKGDFAVQELVSRQFPDARTRPRASARSPRPTWWRQPSSAWAPAATGSSTSATPRWTSRPRPTWAARA